MIYIVGFTFQYNARPRTQSSGVSVQEQIAMARRNLSQPKMASGFDSRFILGTIYKISRIQKVIENEIPKIKYLFSNMDNTSIPDIDVIVSDTRSGDAYVASLCGQSQSHEDARKILDESYVQDTDV